MATFYSAQQTLRNNLETGNGYSLTDGLKTTGGRVHSVFVNYLTTAIAAASNIEFLTLPKDARILRMRMVTGNCGASSTISLGTDVALVDDAGVVTTAAGAANLLAATATSAESATEACATRLLGALANTTAPTKVIGTTAGATLTAGVQITLQVDYMQN